MISYQNLECREIWIKSLIIVTTVQIFYKPLSSSEPLYFLICNYTSVHQRLRMHPICQRFPGETLCHQTELFHSLRTPQKLPPSPYSVGPANERQHDKTLERLGSMLDKYLTGTRMEEPVSDEARVGLSQKRSSSAKAPANGNTSTLFTYKV